MLHICTHHVFGSVADIDAVYMPNVCLYCLFYDNYDSRGNLLLKKIPGVFFLEVHLLQ